MENFRRSLPPLEALVAFEAAARRLSFTAAAAELHLTQAAISRQIRLLEANLGRKLFVRAHRRVVFTPEGPEFQHVVALALRHLARAANDLRQVETDRRLTVATDQSVAALWLVSRLPRFRQAHPGLSVRLVASDIETDCLAEGIDVAIIHGDGAWRGFDATMLLDEAVFPVCSPAYLDRHGPIATAADLSRATLIDLEDEHWNWINWRIWLTEREVPIAEEAERIRINAYPLVVQAARDGLGVALGWKHLVDAYLGDGSLVRPIGDTVETAFGYHLLVPSGALSAAARAFCDWALEERRAGRSGNEGSEAVA